jgi:CubicO group peptidase (beta-lactamase class C family)
MPNKEHRVSPLIARGLNVLFALLLIAAPVTAQTSKALHTKTSNELEGAIAQVDKLFAAEYAKQPQAGATLGVVSGDKLVWAKSYGLGVMLLQLVEQGKVHLSDPVKKYYPEFEKIANPYSYAPPVTLLQLATHTSGLDSEPDDSEKYTTGPVADWEKILLSALSHLKFKYEPGTHFNYSNMGYVILGETLSRAAGEPYIQYVQHHIFEPLGMTHTAFEQNDEILRTLAKGYMLNGNSADPTLPATELRNGRGCKVPSGALFTTVGDMARFLSFEMGYGSETVLKKTVVSDNFSRVYSINGDLTFGYGVGFGITREGDTVAVGHTGGLSGYEAAVFFNPSSQTGIIYLRNAFGSRLDRRDELMAMILAALKALSQ